MNNIKEFIIVDDDAFNNVICEIAIKSEFRDARVRAFEEGIEALQYLRQVSQPVNRPTVLLLDINMPNMSGWEFMERFEKLDGSVTADLKVYIVSSSVDPRDEEKALSNAYISGFISKPLTGAVIQSLGKM